MKQLFLGVCLVLLLTVVCSAEEQAPTPREVLAKVINNDTDEVGTIRLREASGGVLINLKLHSLPPGFHGMHFHKKGDCSDHEGFTTALGHVDPHMKPHGFLHPEGPHEGNLPNLIVAKDGSVEVELYSQLVSFDKGEAALLDEDGSALIIHTNVDDHYTQPIGGSGARIACAVLKSK